MPRYQFIYYCTCSIIKSTHCLDNYYMSIILLSNCIASIYRYKGPSPFLFRTSFFFPFFFSLLFPTKAIHSVLHKVGPLPRAVATFPLVGIWGHFCPPASKIQSSFQPLLQFSLSPSILPAPSFFLFLCSSFSPSPFGLNQLGRAAAGFVSSSQCSSSLLSSLSWPCRSLAQSLRCVITTMNELQTYAAQLTQVSSRRLSLRTSKVRLPTSISSRLPPSMPTSGPRSPTRTSWASSWSTADPRPL